MVEYFFFPFQKYTRNNISIATFRKFQKLETKNRNFNIVSKAVCYAILLERSSLTYPLRMSSIPFLWTRTARIVLRPTYIFLSRRSDTRRKRAALRERIFFPSFRMFYKRRCARDGSSGTCRKETGWKEAAGESSYSERAGGSSVRQPALILWVMHFAIVRLFYFVICYGSVLPLARFYVQVYATYVIWCC